MSEDTPMPDNRIELNEHGDIQFFRRPGISDRTMHWFGISGTFFAAAVSP